MPQRCSAVQPFSRARSTAALFLGAPRSAPARSLALARRQYELSNATSVISTTAGRAAVQARGSKEINCAAASQQQQQKQKQQQSRQQHLSALQQPSSTRCQMTEAFVTILSTCSSPAHWHGERRQQAAVASTVLRFGETTPQCSGPEFSSFLPLSQPHSLTKPF